MSDVVSWAWLERLFRDDELVLFMQWQEGPSLV
jgi:hypothetical protein